MRNPLRLEPVIDTVYKLVPSHSPRRIPESVDTRSLAETVAAAPAHFAAREALANHYTEEGRLAEACQLRWEGAKLVCDLLEESDNEFITLDWEDDYTAQALSMVYDSAVDHFTIGDFEVATAMWELLTDCNPEDHLNASEWLAFCYIALEEWELFDETVALLPEEALSTRLAKYWAVFRRQTLPTAEIRQAMKRETPALYTEWRATEHEITPEYLSDIESRRPTAAAEARRLWLRTEALWREFPEFTVALTE